MGVVIVLSLLGWVTAVLAGYGNPSADLTEPAQANNGAEVVKTLSFGNAEFSRPSRLQAMLDRQQQLQAMNAAQVHEQTAPPLDNLALPTIRSHRSYSENKRVKFKELGLDTILDPPGPHFQGPFFVDGDSKDWSFGIFNNHYKDKDATKDASNDVMDEEPFFLRPLPMPPLDSTSPSPIESNEFPTSPLVTTATTTDTPSNATSNAKSTTAGDVSTLQTMTLETTPTITTLADNTTESTSTIEQKSEIRKPPENTTQSTTTTVTTAKSAALQQSTSKTKQKSKATTTSTPKSPKQKSSHRPHSPKTSKPSHSPKTTRSTTKRTSKHPSKSALKIARSPTPKTLASSTTPRIVSHAMRCVEYDPADSQSLASAEETNLTNSQKQSKQSSGKSERTATKRVAYRKTDKPSTAKQPNNVTTTEVDNTFKNELDDVEILPAEFGGENNIETHEAQVQESGYGATMSEDLAEVRGYGAKTARQEAAPTYGTTPALARQEMSTTPRYSSSTAARLEEAAPTYSAQPARQQAPARQESPTASYGGSGSSRFTAARVMSQKQTSSYATPTQRLTAPFQQQVVANTGGYAYSVSVKPARLEAQTSYSPASARQQLGYGSTGASERLQTQQQPISEYSYSVAVTPARIVMTTPLQATPARQTMASGYSSTPARQTAPTRPMQNYGSTPARQVQSSYQTPARQTQSYGSTMQARLRSPAPARQVASYASTPARQMQSSYASSGLVAPARQTQPTYSTSARQEASATPSYGQMQAFIAAQFAALNAAQQGEPDAEQAISDPDADGIIGLGGSDYPMLAQIKDTSFKCDKQALAGYYADTEAFCQMFHVCQLDGRHDAYLCPNGTVFNQENFICDWWYNVDCSKAPALYVLNAELNASPERMAALNNAGYGGEPEPILSAPIFRMSQQIADPYGAAPQPESERLEDNSYQSNMQLNQETERVGFGMLPEF